MMHAASPASSCGSCPARLQHLHTGKCPWPRACCCSSCTPGPTGMALLCPDGRVHPYLEDPGLVGKCLWRRACCCSSCTTGLAGTAVLCPCGKVNPCLALVLAVLASVPASVASGKCRRRRACCCSSCTPSLAGTAVPCPRGTLHSHLALVRLPHTRSSHDLQSGRGRSCRWCYQCPGSTDSQHKTRLNPGMMHAASPASSCG